MDGYWYKGHRIDVVPKVTFFLEIDGKRVSVEIVAGEACVEQKGRGIEANDKLIARAKELLDAETEGTMVTQEDRDYLYFVRVRNEDE